MSRKSAYITATWEGRDKGRTYKITEMPASQAEEWGARLLTAVGRTGLDLPPGMFALGMEVLAYVGIKGLIAMHWEEARPLLEEMMGCVERVPDLGNQNFVRPLVEEDIEEVMTRVRLRDAVIELHVGFSVAAVLSNLTTSRTTAKTEETDSPPADENGDYPKTSPVPSPPPLVGVASRRTRRFKPR